MISAHDEIRDLLPEYLRDGLDERRTVQVRAHLIGCDECRTELALLRELAAVPAPDPGDLFWKTLPRRVTAQVGAPGNRHAGWLRWFVRPVALAAGITLIAVATFVVLQFSPAPAPMTTSRGTANHIAESKSETPADPKKTPDVRKEQPLLALNERGTDDVEAGVLGIELFAALDDPLGGSGAGDLASFNEKELERLYHALRKDASLGG